MALLDKRRRALAAEGLFDAERKRKLPFLPRVIGVVTSPTGAVIRDILHRLEDRCPTHVIVWPVPVQGEGASAKVAQAIRGFRRDRARRSGAAPGLADRRARRRLDRGPVGLQRGRGGPRGGRIADPADLGGRARDGHHPDRLRVRHARADADGCRRDGRAGAGRAAGAGRRSRPPVGVVPDRPCAASARAARPDGSSLAAAGDSVRAGHAAGRRPGRAPSARACGEGGPCPGRPQRGRAAPSERTADRPRRARPAIGWRRCGGWPSWPIPTGR